MVMKLNTTSVSLQLVRIVFHYCKLISLNRFLFLCNTKLNVYLGSTPKNLELFEAADDKVKSMILPYRTIDDFLELEENVHNPDVKNIVIIGGGFLGSELACSLAQNRGFHLID